MIIFEIAAAAILPMVVAVGFVYSIGLLYEFRDKIKLRHAKREKSERS